MTTKRRGPRGMGSVYQPTYKAKDGTLRKAKVYWIRYTDENGERHIESSTYRNKNGAQQVLTERLSKVHSGDLADYLKVKDYKLKQVTDGLREHYKALGRRSTKKLERNLDHVDKFFGDGFRADTLTAEHLANYRTHRRSEGAKEPTLSHELRSLKTALRLARREGRIRRMPEIQIPNDSNRKDEGEFTAKQFAALLTELPAYLKPLVRFLWFTGMRVMEPVGLKWDEVNLEHGELRISGRRTKSGKQKVLYLAGEPLHVLKNQPTTGDRVFTDENGDALRYDAILEVFQQACKRAKIVEGFTDADGAPRQPGFHDLRRTFARVANRAGVPHAIIMEIAGWRSEAMLIRYLGDTKPADQRSAFERLAISTS